MQIKRYRINPRTVTAVQVQQRGHKDIANWCGGYIAYTRNGRTLRYIELNPSTPYARIGDWIVYDDLLMTFNVYSDEDFRELFSLTV